MDNFDLKKYLAEGKLLKEDELVGLSKVDIPKEGTKTFKKGTKIKNLNNGKITTITKDITVTFPISKEQRRKIVNTSSPEFKTPTNPTGTSQIGVGSLFIGQSGSKGVELYSNEKK